MALLLKLGGSIAHHTRIAEDKVKRLPGTALRASSDVALGCLIYKNEADVSRDTCRVNQVRRPGAVGIYGIATRNTLSGGGLLTGEIGG